MSASLIVTVCRWETTSEELRALFPASTGGEVQTRISEGRERSKGFGLVDFDSVEAATAALNSSEGLQVGERVLTLQYGRTPLTEE